MELVQLPDGSWAEPAPELCPAGHSLHGRHLVGWHPCDCAGGNGHRTHQCPDCDVLLYDPPHDPGQATWEG